MSESDGSHGIPYEDTAPFKGAGRAASYVEDVAVAEVGPTSWVSAPEATALPPMPAARPNTPATLIEEVNSPMSDLLADEPAAQPGRATRGFRGALGRVGIRLAPSGAEKARLEADAAVRRDEQVIRQATWTRAVGVLVANPKGGVGKTPVSVLLGGTLATIRGGSVAVIEVSDDPGTLTFRAEGKPALGMGELVRDVDAIRSAGQLAGYTAPQTSFASIIGSTGARPALSGNDVRRVSSVVDDYYAVRIMDSGNQPSSDAFVGAIDAADVLVIPVLNSADVVLGAMSLLERMRLEGGHSADLANHAIVLRLTDGRPEDPRIMERLSGLLERSGVRETYAIPYDAHVAERGELTLAKLTPATRSALTTAAAGIVRSLQLNAR
ncbi:MinD/ParA family protein [Amnibacterium flavum]|uniref:CobQ/CobB/MinD/ParA nucleotide binding domain-containing protein n=1 Tax=Amnibacterium flavum TaxID=2173173 RepID=A0A2V1HPY2_9MICO|nr:ParA family protein [Amnibacterium flavum]PVZ93189.1 hypothetical protein DDQ50_16835 [Amnibacterium flavum]